METLELVWFRNDLRCRDQSALARAREQGPVVAVYCFCPEQLARHGVGGNRIAFLLRCLKALRKELDDLGMPLKVLRCPTFDAVPKGLLSLARTIGARRLWFNDEYPVNERLRDSGVEDIFAGAGIDIVRGSDTVIRAPGTVLTQAGTPYTVFTPFRRRWLESIHPEDLAPLPRPRRQTRPDISSDDIPDLPSGCEVQAPADMWPGGEDEALKRLERFVDVGLEGYREQRDFPAMDGTSTLSPWLSVGAVSPRQCLHAALECNDGRLDGGSAGATTWITELIWREFYRHVTAAFPHVSRGQAFRPDYDAMQWRADPEQFDAWREGRTGYPLVDAAMRQLAQTGWMHNRLRMVVAMFLSKNLLLDWRLGEAHFMEHLVDGDFASNNGGWQWSASTGTDAAPYFRVFNPVTQSRRFDPDGHFIRRYVPELASLGLPQLHAPWKAHDALLEYPGPLVDAAASRRRAIDAFRALGG
ncbi:MAG: deoxyribodipyrimidine photo-lyase [Gammaproteobacteria bacterium]|nr:MAG: deoxyribodipyrimidine photo-lyase [Gammaproteobacteria bacterium]